MTGHFLITILATNADRTEFYVQSYISSPHIKTLEECEVFAQDIAEVCFDLDRQIEQISIKKVAEAQL